MRYQPPPPPHPVRAFQVMEHLLKAFQPAAEVSPESSVGVPDSDPDDDTDPEARPLRPPSPAAYRPVVAFSIHQPSEAIFRMFDQLMLFAQGHVLYHGPAGQALPHFAGVGHAFPAGRVPCKCPRGSAGDALVNGHGQSPGLRCVCAQVRGC